MHTRHNKKVYDTLASEFKAKRKLRYHNDKKIVDMLVASLPGRSHPLILDIGPGNGQMAHLLTKQGCRVDAIDVSKQMAAVAKETAPKANVIVGNFLSHRFHNKQYDGILAIAFIHLFPKTRTQAVLRKMKRLLKEDGVLLLSTTRHRKSEEGFFIKQNFEKKLKRFRKRFTKRELERTLVQSGFQIVRYEEKKDREEGKAKRWMSFVVQPTT